MQCGFNLQHYKECIISAKDKGYQIIPVKDYETYTDFKYDKLILMRHDIDFSLEYAYELANFEYDLGICSSYYVYLHGIYNALAPKSMEMIRQMKGMGHEIGWHYDTRHELMHEYRIIGDIISEDLKTRTQHNPSMTNKYVGGTIIQPIDLPLKYISDSGRNWREKCMCNHIGKVDKLHINTHPEWWLHKGASRDEVIHNLIVDAKQNLNIERNDIVVQMKEYCRDLNIEY